MAKSLVPQTGRKGLSRIDLLYKMGKASFSKAASPYGISSTSKLLSKVKKK
jgi:hypothetical protein